MTFILVVHIALMLISMTATSIMAITAAASRPIHPAFIRSNMFATVTGILCGMSLLFTQPIGAKCVILLTYTVAFAVTYSFISRRNQFLPRSES